MLIDSHCHILKNEYENPKKIIEDSFNNNIDKLIINGYDYESSKEAVDIANYYDNVFVAVGIGPENINNVTDKTYNEIESLLCNTKVKAIGEIGLDYYWTKENKEEQIIVFKNMLQLANKYNLPVIVHCRDAFEDTYNLLKEYKVKGILHCYSGSLEMAKRFIDLGFLIGIGGVVTFKNAKKLQEVVKYIDIRAISLETDSPYLAPEPYRGKQNKPEYLYEIAKKIAEIKGLSTEEVIDITSSNVVGKFDL